MKRGAKIEKAFKDLKRELEIGSKQEQSQLERIIQRLDASLATMKHDLRDREGLYQTGHPTGIIELACHVHEKVLEIKIKQELIEWLERAQRL